MQEMVVVPVHRQGVEAGRHDAIFTRLHLCEGAMTV